MTKKRKKLRDTVAKVVKPLHPNQPEKAEIDIHEADERSDMNAEIKDQFETLESAHDFVALLATTVAEAKRGDVERESAASRHRDALRIALYNLGKLELHVNQSRRILNDLRTLRRLLFEERSRTNPDTTSNERSAGLLAA